MGTYKTAKTINSLEFLLGLAQHTRESGISWSRGYSIDQKILDFAQKYKGITFRESRVILKKITAAKTHEKNLVGIASEHIKIDSNYTWTINALQEPVIYPSAYINGQLVSFLEIMTNLLETDQNINERYQTFKTSLLAFSEAIEPVCRWVDKSFYEGRLESWIISYKAILAEKKKRTFVGKELLGNFIEPEKTEVILEKGEAPLLSVGEREAFQFLLWKVENLSEEEQVIKNDFILEGREENVKKDGIIVIFEMKEALKKGYGDLYLQGHYYERLKDSMQSLLEKKRKIFIRKRKGTLEFSSSLIDKLEMTFTPSGQTEGKKYILARIPFDVINYHGKYTAFPANHFALLRTTPPKTTVDKTETRFFDILCNEKPYKKEQSRIVRRIKNSFLEMLGGNEVVENKNKARLAKQVEGFYALKAINLGLLKSLKEEINRQGEEVYVFAYEKHEEIEKYLNGQRKQDPCA